MSKKILLGFLIVTFSVFWFSNLICEEDYSISSLKFLDLVRQNHPINTWAMMSGEISHKRKGAKTITTPIKLSVRFTDTRVLTQITIGTENKEETYTVGQPYNDDDPSIITSAKSRNVCDLAHYGLRPEDLTMAFLYWKFDKELPKTTLKGMNCRVLLLSNSSTKEDVRVYITSDYYYPMKAEWIKSGESEAYRTYYINSFKEVGKLWAPDSFDLCGPGWRTNVEFDKVSLGFVKDGLPESFFKSL